MVLLASQASQKRHSKNMPATLLGSYPCECMDKLMMHQARCSFKQQHIQCCCW